MFYSSCLLSNVEEGWIASVGIFLLRFVLLFLEIFAVLEILQRLYY